MELQLGLCSNSGDHPRQQMTIFYNGRVSISDVTELQARAILEMAKKELEMEEKRGGGEAGEEMRSGALPPVRVMNPGQSMKRSLQRFLQKRKKRIADSSPYGVRPPLLQLFSS
ncbi:protein TIFY 5A-like [Phalaenopsis equestris]|uniref:protein TIFY 5A-like n=1 Tax=Phalaenopsis equestris TaxID=78828 RepID=UPI0009E31F4D|nr:protein TIFY 5A-like [Phalaenopsis equestris]